MSPVCYDLHQTSHLLPNYCHQKQESPAMNKHFQDEAINCTIKWAPSQPTAGIYAKRGIRLNEELFTRYGKPQWIYTLKLFAHTLSPRTIQDTITRYNILPTDQLAPCLANQSDLFSSQLSPQPSTLAPNTSAAHGPAPPMDLTAPESTLPQALTGPVPPTAAPPHTPTFPHGTHEGVATAPSQMPSAGQGL